MLSQAVEEGSVTEERDLDQLLKFLDPVLNPERYVFCSSTKHAIHIISATTPLATFQEKEGLSLVLKKEQAVQHGLDTGQEFCRITLNVHSSLEAVGLTAAVTACLANAGISANIISAYYHDYIFVPAEQAGQALSTLKNLCGP